MKCVSTSHCIHGFMLVHFDFVICPGWWNSHFRDDEEKEIEEANKEEWSSTKGTCIILTARWICVQFVNVISFFRAIINVAYLCEVYEMSSYSVCVLDRIGITITVNCVYIFRLWWKMWQMLMKRWSSS